MADFPRTNRWSDGEPFFPGDYQLFVSGEDEEKQYEAQMYKEEVKQLLGRLEQQNVFGKETVKAQDVSTQSDHNKNIRRMWITFKEEKPIIFCNCKSDDNNLNRQETREMNRFEDQLSAFAPNKLDFKALVNLNNVHNKGLAQYIEATVKLAERQIDHNKYSRVFKDSYVEWKTLPPFLYSDFAKHEDGTLVWEPRELVVSGFTEPRLVFKLNYRHKARCCEVPFLIYKNGQPLILMKDPREAAVLNSYKRDALDKLGFQNVPVEFIKSFERVDDYWGEKKSPNLNFHMNYTGVILVMTSMPEAKKLQIEVKPSMALKLVEVCEGAIAKKKVAKIDRIASGGLLPAPAAISGAPVLSGFKKPAPVRSHKGRGSESSTEGGGGGGGRKRKAEEMVEDAGLFNKGGRGGKRAVSKKKKTLSFIDDEAIEVAEGEEGEEGEMDIGFIDDE